MADEWYVPIRCDSQTNICQTPTVTINGSVAVRNRGLFGQYDASQQGVLTTGYNKVLSYPKNMQYGQTAWWPKLEQNAWAPIPSLGELEKLIVSPASITVAEGGTTGYTVKLSSEPTSDVIVNISPEPGSDSDISIDTDTRTSGDQTELTFTTTNWTTSQTVTASAAGDIDSCNGIAEFDHVATSSGKKYGSATITIIEDDSTMTRAPCAPEAPTLTIGKGSIKVEWRAPSRGGGSAITGIRSRLWHRYVVR